MLIGAGGVALGAGIFAALPPPRSGTIVSDARFAASRAFGRDAARDGRRIVWIEGDVTAAYNEIDLLWRRAKVAVSGFTAYGAFFCLERLAMDRGLRVAAKREHREETLLIAWTIAPRSREASRENAAGCERRGFRSRHRGVSGGGGQGLGVHLRRGSGALSRRLFDPLERTR